MQKLWPYILFAVSLSFLPHFLNFEDMLSAKTPSELTGETRPIARSMEPLQTKSETDHVAGLRQVRIKADQSGHFRSAFEINGRHVDGMIDTGATYVAMNQSTARSLGIRLTPSDFIHKARTANGETKAALATLKRVQIGSISIKNVDAFVLDDSSLSSTLIGMSFMSELSSFQFKNSQLVLTQ